MSNVCMYCADYSEKVESQMVFVTALEVSRVYLTRDQYYLGRCVVAYKKHCNELFEMTTEDRNAFFTDVSRVAAALKKLFSPGKLNYGIYGDKVPHVHVHLVPKYEELEGWGGAFELPLGKCVLTEPQLKEQVEKLAAALKEYGGE